MLNRFLPSAERSLVAIEERRNASEIKPSGTAAEEENSTKDYTGVPSEKNWIEDPWKTAVCPTSIGGKTVDHRTTVAKTKEETGDNRNLSSSD